MVFGNAVFGNIRSGTNGGLVARVADWPYSTFHSYVDVGLYPKDWAGEVPDLQVGERNLAAEGAALFRPTR